MSNTPTPLDQCVKTPNVAGWTGWAVAFGCVALVGIGFFWHRRDIQPIKAREPGIVVFAALAIVVYTVVLCISRIYVCDFPCWLNLWFAYVGTVLVLTTYLVC